MKQRGVVIASRYEEENGPGQLGLAEEIWATTLKIML
jgi:hypothetical protein